MSFTLHQKIILPVIVVPLLVTLFFIGSSFMLGDPGFKVDKKQHGLLITEIYDQQNPVQHGDLIVAINGLSYGQVLGYLFNHPVQAKEHSITLERNGELVTITLNTTDHTFSSLLVIIWPHIILIILFLSLGITALLKATTDKATTLFFLMTCGFSCFIASMLASYTSLLTPSAISASFFGLILSSWYSLSAWAHFVCCFPKERDITQNNPWLPPLFYIIPPFVTIGTSLSVTGITPEFWTSLQQFHYMSLPIIISGTFIKHFIDYLKLRGNPARNQVKLPLAGYGLSFGPYLFLYLIPNIILNHPLIYFRTVILAVLILPFSYLFALLRYRLFEVDKVISRIMAYIVMIISITLLYSLLLIAIKRWLWGKGILSEELFLVFLVAVITLFNPALNRVQKAINRYIFKNVPIQASILHTLSSRISATILVSDLVQIVTRDFTKQFALSKMALVIIDKKQVQIYPENSVKTFPDLTDQKQILDRFKFHKDYLHCRPDPENAQHSKEMEELRTNGWTMIFLLQGSTALTGLLYVGEKINGHLFNDDDIHLLATLSNHTGIALENGLRYERLAKSKKLQEDTFNKLMQKEKMAAIGEMTTTLAHELKNPLAIIRSSAQYISEGNQSSSVSQEMLDYIIDEVDALNLTISSLLGLARHRAPLFKPVDLHSAIPAIINRWRQSDDHIATVEIICEMPEPLPLVYCDINQISQIILNLVRNAEEAMEQSGIITIQVSNTDNHALITIVDNGPGIDREHLHHIFENFFTTKVSGIGLGLPVCRQLIHAHNGSINIKNRNKGGTEALLLLPFEPFEDIAIDDNMKDSNVV